MSANTLLSRYSSTACWLSFAQPHFLAFVYGDLKTPAYSASIENEGKIFHFHFYACQTLRKRLRAFETARQSWSDVFVSALIQAEKILWIFLIIVTW
jgi:hypothetical protein